MSKPFALRSLQGPFRASLALALVAAAATSAGCSGGGGGASLPFCEPAESCPASAEGVDLEAPVSFQTDVFPIFQRTCNDSACHGSVNNSAADLYLGSDVATPSTDELANIVADLTNNPSAIGPAGTFDVVAGNWQDSFLMLKVDGCQNDAGIACIGNKDSQCEPATDCGDAMPQLDAKDAAALEVDPYPLAADDRHTIRRWIHQGAQNN